MSDGAVTVKTWTPSDEAQLARVRYARQNGVPLIEFDPAHGASTPGNLVNLWGPGNWSGSANEDLRTLRAGLCLQENGSHRFLIYGYFSSATPSAMARVFQGITAATPCNPTSMHRSIRISHSTCATANERLIEHLVDSMQEVDRKAGNRLRPAFWPSPMIETSSTSPDARDPEHRFPCSAPPIER